MIKVKIAQDMASMSYNFYIYHEDERGNRFFAKPVILEIEKKETPDNYIIEPTFKIDSAAFKLAVENMPEITDQMIKQKEVDKNFHIKSLEGIIGQMIGGKNA